MTAPFPNLPPTPDTAIVWQSDSLYLLDQRDLPSVAKYLQLRSAAATANAIRDMVVRGAPAIGVTAAYGVVLAAREAFAENPTGWKQGIAARISRLRMSRPTASNLFWALGRMQQLIEQLSAERDPEAELLAEAVKIHERDVADNMRMGEMGAELIDGPTRVITHCNAGALATGGYGTALGVIRSAFARGSIHQVYADETRPWLQGSRLTAWELLQDGIPVTLLADGAAASLMSRGDIGWIIVGSDRIAANGDVANKIGTYGLAVAAKHHGVRVMVVAPTSTVDMQMASGQEIPIEVRGDDEVLGCGGKQIGADGAEVWNPVFDVTPAELVDVIVTEKGIVHSPTRKKLEKLITN
ncbi:MAG: S-methyl-5-thioribose-1-phosphate isomerase [Gammaproteobacteria bacterium]|nr:S-methyl-5-thioribose-1-phosphate isomerase [Gammaproteobacteria bacterium]